MSTMDSFHFTCLRFPSKEKRDGVRKTMVVFGSDSKPVPNEDDYIATGTDEEGFYFVMFRDKEQTEDTVFTYLSDGAILKNNVNPKSYKDIFNQ